MKSIRISGAEETLEVSPQHVRDLFHYSNCAGSVDAKLCLALIKKTNAWPHVSAKFRMEFTAGFLSSVESALLPVSPQPDRTYELKIGQPTVSYFLKQAAGIAKGAGKTGEACCCKGVLGPTPGSPFWAVSVSPVCLVHPLIDVIFMSQNDSRKRIIYFYLLLCEETSSQSATANIASPALSAHTFSSFLCFCILFFFYLSNLKSFVCEGHETAGMVSVRAVYEIAQVKAQDECFKMRNSSMETVVKCIIGSARSLGIKVVNE